MGVSLLCLLAALLPQPWALQNLSFDAALWRAKPWTLWTSALVHLSPAHLWGNVAALAALALLGQQLRLPAVAAAAWLLAWPLTTLALLAWPEITRYSGLSGIIHANVSVLWVYTAIKNRVKWLSFMLFIGVSLKLLHERAWQSSVVYSPDWGFDVVLAAHLAGAGVGGVIGCFAQLSNGRKKALLVSRRQPALSQDILY